ncbi:MAG: carbohydrate ABC transporter permease [Eisenbergiella massiliensis]
MKAKKLYPTWFALGALIFYLGLFFLPGIMGIGYSFTDWNTYSSEVNFVGWKNYLKVFEGGNNYGMYIKNTLLFTAVSSVTKTTLGIALAVLLTNKMVKMKSMHRMLVFLPQVMSFLIIGLVFKNILHPSRGFINITLKAIGLDFFCKELAGGFEFCF